MEFSGKRKQNWMKRYKLLKKYYEEFGDIDIPSNYIVDGMNLNEWLDRQRQAYRGAGSLVITKEQIALLNKLKIIWDVRQDNWDENYSLLEKYYKEFGNIDVPSNYVVVEVNLGRWVRSQREAYNGIGKGKITSDQI